MMFNWLTCLPLTDNVGASFAVKPFLELNPEDLDNSLTNNVYHPPPSIT